ncbi:hypothetical protein WJ542_04105 [Paraburkholderia sp. B3]|uniref:hypothetical protein n=1 Tax=Paraburkholderia sp. B3 TaxID=3134791 RepID=UPI0039827216
MNSLPAFTGFAMSTARRVSSDDSMRSIGLASATFENAKGHPTLPIVISFTPNATEKVAAALDQLAIGCRVTKRERVLMFLSVIGYLESVRELPSGSLRTHVERITAGGVQKDRAEIVVEYEDFCERAAKDLPYDVSLEVLAFHKYSGLSAEAMSAVVAAA